MIHPSESTHGRAVRDGQGAPITCAACGCRLDRADDQTWVHFGRFAGRDARGCRVPCVESGHDSFGLPVAALSA
jgi:hypothetical protein